MVWYPYITGKFSNGLLVRSIMDRPLYGFRTQILYGPVLVPESCPELLARRQIKPLSAVLSSLCWVISVFCWVIVMVYFVYSEMFFYSKRFCWKPSLWSTTKLEQISLVYHLFPFVCIFEFNSILASRFLLYNTVS